MAHRIKSVLVTTGACAALLGGAGLATADSGAQGAAVNSPGVVSGNVVQIPVQVPVHVCGNSINVIGLLNPTFGNPCVND
ncbi:chaplin [Streptomyces lydicus]|uniref:chaplin n=1 Tax=Streptomyces lydicus TaxID=47763 RepID=UPI00379CD8C6